MRKIGTGLVVGVGLLALAIGACFSRDDLYGQDHVRPAFASVDGSLIAFDAAIGDGGRQLVVVDPRQRVVSVYHIDRDGAISLRSVRNIRWDLLMEEFNGGEPRPQDIRALVEPARQVSGKSPNY